MTSNIEYKPGFLPLFKLPRTFYDPQAKHTHWWSPFHHPSRTNRVYIAIIVDWILILLLFGLTQWFFVGPQPPKAYFSLDDESLKHPIVDEVISANNATIINAVGPYILLLVLEVLFFWDRWDVYHLTTGHAQAIAMSLCFTSFFWISVGGHLGLRPTFLTKCKPDLSKVIPNVTYYDNSICTETLSKFEYQGFPSGHSSTAFAGWLFFTLYINGKAKPWSGGAHFWKVLILLVPLAFAAWISLTRVIDFHHFPYQIVLGSIIGIMSSLIAFRLNFVVNGWFVALGNNNDHIPAHYHFLQEIEAKEEDHENEKRTERSFLNGENNV
ncbi:11761_t:CDS:2 [Ambispora leptoticha]|uniref:11761_t:CDS:1 n=1 Tax=Ambispora leptoticha TaxID=144679 RepID=A0A9N8VBF4_9GLOM|nr:11761_t:CDS:2 [Ambispora leptoticha]